LPFLDVLYSNEFWLFLGVGFLAQLIDGALGMAYGVVCIAVLSASGIPAAQASAVVHAAEVFTTGAAGASHAAHKNVDWRLLSRLAPAGVLGGVLGAYVVTEVRPEIVGPLVSLYLSAMGVLLLARAFRAVRPARDINVNLALPLGAAGGFLDAWGGGWGPVVASTLLGGGHAPRKVVGTVSVAEFFVACAISAAFVVAMLTGTLPLDIGTYGTEVAGLIVGGLAAAPLAGFVARLAPPRYLMTGVGLLVLSLAAWQLVRSFS